LAHNILNIILILVAAKLFGEIFERVGQTPVLGELVGGVILGGSVLGLVRANETLLFLSQLGAIFLLFEIGMESDLGRFLRVGPSAFVVAMVGTVGSFAAGYLVARLLGFSGELAVFIGAAFTATSVAITARTLKDIGSLNSSEAQVILGAAVIDDVMGLIILAVVGGALACNGASGFAVTKTAVLAVVFLVGAIAVGVPMAPYILRLGCRFQSRGIMTVGAIVFCLSLAFIAEKLQLAAIVGAFAAGLILSRSEHTVRIQGRIKPIADFLIPVFFVLLGTSVNVGILNPFNPANRAMLALMSALFVAAVIMKLVAGLCVPVRGLNRLAIGAGMVPRGEVSLIFAGTGLARHFITQGEYSAFLGVVMLTTFLTPPVLRWSFRGRALAPANEEQGCEVP
jgi:Kef-type K+ transport system membrane component KefB